MSVRRLSPRILLVLVALGGFAGGVLVSGRLADSPSTNVAAPAPGASDDPTVDTDLAPPFRFRDQDGRERSLADWAGRPVLVNFWATWCPPCLTEIPLLVRTQAHEGENGLQVVGIALDEAEPVARFWAEHGVNYPTASGAEVVLDLLRRFGGTQGALPFTALVGADGRIVTRHTGILDESSLAALLAHVR
ncbi:MAG: TlpA family protein disulfide reductase [Ectothiorhodospiraceae bacterium]|nr:TlpA family protein disulfide reductase [Chromatiales bacterium]MCP5157011.1 TlpA family protein disulfide reductase [Ectothiorhodospiraceae bacterium]